MEEMGLEPGQSGSRAVLFATSLDYLSKVQSSPPVSTEEDHF